MFAMADKPTALIKTFVFHLFIYSRKKRLHGQRGQMALVMITGLQLIILPMFQDTALIVGD